LRTCAPTVLAKMVDAGLLSAEGDKAGRAPSACR
jgi:hypothetical protein